MFAPVIVLLAFVAPWIQAAIIDQFDCTTYNPVAANPGFEYNANATSCTNSIDDATCQLLFDTSPSGGPFPKPGGQDARPTKCYSTAPATPFAVNPETVSAATSLCPKTCGYCCKTTDYNCRNVQFPRVNCASVTSTQCRDINWRTILAEDCPAACGLCNQEGCVDTAIQCANDPSICLSIGLQDFVNTYCRRTCGRCTATTTRASTGTVTGTCTSYIADSSTSCRAWSTNGFCTNNFYTVAQRRSYCATTCRIC